MTLISSTISLVPTQTMDGRTVYAKPSALGCPDCNGGCGTLGSAGEQLFEGLKDYLLVTRAPITFYSKPPGDWFPLVNNEKAVEAGRTIGSVLEYRITSDDELWMKANLVTPGWFKYDPSMINLKTKAGGTLSPELKEQIIKDIFGIVAPGGKIVVKAGEVLQTGVETVGKTLDLANAIMKNLPLIALGVGGLIIYVKYGDDIKKAFSKKSPATPVSGPPKKAVAKRKVKVIHV